MAKQKYTRLQSGVNHLENTLLHEAQREALLPRNIPKTVNEMLLDPIVGGSLVFLKSLLMRDWWIEDQKDATAEQKKINRKLNESLSSLEPYSKRQFLENALSAIEYGGSVAEITLQRKDGIYSFQSLTPINIQNIAKWRFRKGSLVNVTINKPQNDSEYLTNLGEDQVTISGEKVIHFKLNPSIDRPLGVSLLESVYVPTMMRKIINEYVTINTAKNAGGIFACYLPDTYLQTFLTDPNSAESKLVEYIKDGLANLHAGMDSYIILPSNVYPDTSVRQFEVKPLSEANQSNYSADQDLERLARDITFGLQSSIAQLGSQKGTSGSFALADSRTSLLTHFIKNIQAMFSDEMKRKAIKLAYELNGLDTDNLPGIAFEKVEEVDFETMSKSVQRLSQAGLISPTEDLEGYLRDFFDLPQADYTKPLQTVPKADPVERLETDKEL